MELTRNIWETALKFNVKFLHVSNELAVFEELITSKDFHHSD